MGKKWPKNGFWPHRAKGEKMAKKWENGHFWPIFRPFLGQFSHFVGHFFPFSPVGPKSIFRPFFSHFGPEARFGVCTGQSGSQPSSIAAFYSLRGLYTSKPPSESWKEISQLVSLCSRVNRRGLWLSQICFGQVFRKASAVQESSFSQAMLQGVVFRGVRVLRWKRLILLHEKRPGEPQIWINCAPHLCRPLKHSMISGSAKCYSCKGLRISGVRKRVLLADVPLYRNFIQKVFPCSVPGPQTPERGHICQNRSFTKLPFCFLSRIWPRNKTCENRTCENWPSTHFPWALSWESSWGPSSVFYTEKTSTFVVISVDIFMCTPVRIFESTFVREFVGQISRFACSVLVWEFSGKEKRSGDFGHEFGKAPVFPSSRPRRPWVLLRIAPD